MANVGKDFSLAEVLAPLPLSALPVVFEVLAHIPRDLAAVFVKEHLQHDQGLDFFFQTKPFE